jgi:outer membrane protein TolC
LSVSADWAFDGTTIANIRARDAAAEVARARADRARDVARDQIHAAFHRARAEVVKTKAARAQLDASILAASLSRERYTAGTATLLDVITADRDAFAAEVALIRADADRSYARVLLELAVGRSQTRRKEGRDS